ncbi:MAG: ATP-dependent DNA ligase [Candidatus Diapherotrites archaeon]|nr:ATP-dependent DNA ligase [Candidatus Diapherotrites archaeon]
MELSEVVKYLKKLENTTKRLEMTDIVTDMLKNAGQDLKYVILFAQGRAFPPWDRREVGVAEKMMIKCISLATGISEKKVEMEITKTGDTGIAAQNLFKHKVQMTLQALPLSLKEVYHVIDKISHLEGAKSQDRKVKYVVELLNNASPDEVKYLVRLLLGEMRLGVGEGIIRDAISNAFDVDVNLVERAYSLINDYGEVAEIAREKGNEGLSKIQIKLGRPLKPMLAQAVHSIKEAFESFKPAAFEYKYDGMRCITGLTPLYIKGEGIKSIRNIKPGDYVLTHKGRYKKITAKMKRKIDKHERIFRLQTFYGHEFKITEGHKILALKGDKLSWVPVEKLDKSCYVAFPLPKLKSKPIPKQMTLKTIDGYKKTFRLNNNFFRFIGYWVGDGFSNEYNKTHRIGLMFNKRDVKLKEFYKKIVCKEFGITNISEYTHNGGISIYWTDRAFLSWLSRNFREKRLPEWFFGVTKEQFQSFLKGWIDADGHVDKDGRTTVVTKEAQLASSAQLIALKFGMVFGVKRFRVNGSTYFKLIITKNNRATKLRGNYLLVKLLKLEEVQHPDPRTVVYNLEVEGDESYCSTLLSLHNCQVHIQNDKITLFTRRLENVTKQFPDVVEAVKEAVKCENAIIEGEAVAVDEHEHPLPFQNLSRRIKRKYGIDEMVKKIPCVLYLFDCMYLNNESYIDAPFKNRRATLKKILKETPGKIYLSKALITSDEKEAEAFYKEALEKGHEGVMIKNLDAEYKPGSRVGYMYKLKPISETLDLVIVGAYWGEGRRANWLGSFVLACRDPDTNEFLEIGKMATGLTDEQLQYLTDILKNDMLEQKGKFVKLRPALVVEVGYQEIQKSPTYSSGYALRFPRLIRIREDRSPDECDTIDRVDSLYERTRKR